MGWLIWKRAAVQDLLFMHSLPLAQRLCAKNTPAAFATGDLFSQMGTPLIPSYPKDLSHFCKSSCNMQGSPHFSKSMLCSSNSPPHPSRRFVPRGQEETWTWWTAVHSWGALGKGVGAHCAVHLKWLLAHNWAVLNHQLWQEGGSKKTPHASWRCWLNCVFCFSHNPNT